MRRALPAALLTVALAGCSALRAPSPPALSPDKLPSVAELQQIIQDRRQALQSLRCEARLSFSGAQRSGSVRQALLVERPDRLRVEVFSPLGTAFVLATAGGRIAAYVRDEHRLYRGAATRTNLAQYAPVDLDIPDVIEVLLGNPPQRDGTHPSVSYDATKGRVRLWQRTPSGAQIVSFAGAPLVPVESEELGAADDVLWRASFSHHANIQETQVPLEIRLDLLRQGEHVEITLDEPEVNPSLAATLFALQTPPGIEEVSLDAMMD